MNLKSYHIVIYFISLLIICSFKSNRIKNEDLEGIWVFTTNKKDTFEFTKMRYFDKNKAGFEFKSRGKIIKRQNSCWCGNPPIKYKNYKGTWKYISDSTILINHKYWGGQAEMEILILDLNENFIRLKYLSSKNN
jgi:hypothetical protein